MEVGRVSRSHMAASRRASLVEACLLGPQCTHRDSGGEVQPRAHTSGQLPRVEQPCRWRQGAWTHVGMGVAIFTDGHPPPHRQRGEERPPPPLHPDASALTWRCLHTWSRLLANRRPSSLILDMGSGVGRRLCVPADFWRTLAWLLWFEKTRAEGDFRGLKGLGLPSPSLCPHAPSPHDINRACTQ